MLELNTITKRKLKVGDEIEDICICCGQPVKYIVREILDSEETKVRNFYHFLGEVKKN